MLNKRSWYLLNELLLEKTLKTWKHFNHPQHIFFQYPTSLWCTLFLTSLLLFYSLTSPASDFKICTLLLINRQFCKTFNPSQTFRAIFSHRSLLPSLVFSLTLLCCHTNVHLALLFIPHLINLMFPSFLYALLVYLISLLLCHPLSPCHTTTLAVTV